MTTLGTSYLILVFVVLISIVQANWLLNRNIQFESAGQPQPLATPNRLMSKKFLPPRYQNLWGQGESSKISEAAVASNIYKMPTQQKQVFAWQPQSIDSTVW